MIAKVLSAVLVLATAGCGDGGELASSTGETGGSGGSGGGSGTTAACESTESGCLEFSHTYDVHTIEPGFQSDKVCESWTLNNPEELFVNSVHFEQEGGYHHSNWYFVPNTMFPRPDGTFDCAEEKVDGLALAVAGGVLYVQAIDATDETLAFPEGVVVRIPPYSRVIGTNHLLNARADDLTVAARMTIKAIPKAEVVTKLTPIKMTYHDLHLPPMARSEFTGKCDFQKAQGGKPLTSKLYYMTPHYHAHGTQFRLAANGGPDDGKVLGQLDTEPQGVLFTPPIDLTGALGLSLTCAFNNTTSKEIVWDDNDVDQEMCLMLAFIDGETAFAAEVADGQNHVDGMDGTTVLNSGTCGVLGVGWKDKKGGTPPK